MKILLFAITLLAFTSCTEGEKSVQVEGVKSPIQPTHDSSGFTYPPSPVPPENAFASLGYPFSRTSGPFNLTVKISNPNGMAYIHKWYLNSVDQSSPSLFYTMDPSDSGQFPNGGIQTVTSTIFDSTGLIELSSVSWWFEILTFQKPRYTSFTPDPAPVLFPGSPILETDPNSEIVVTIANPENENYIHKWFLDGNPMTSFFSDEKTPLQPFPIDPSNSVLFYPGSHTVVSQITENPNDSIIIQQATWTFVIRALQDSEFTTFTGQQPSPEPFPDMLVGTPLTIDLDPDTLFNPDLASYILEWRLDGVLQATETNPKDQNINPTPYTIDMSDINLYGVGTHAVDLTLLDNKDGASPTVVDTRNWTFNVLFPPPTTLEDVFPDVTVPLVAVSGVPLDGSPSSGFYRDPVDNTSRGTELVIGNDSFCVEVADGRGIGYLVNPTLAGIQVNYYHTTVGPANLINSSSPLYFEKQNAPPKVCLDGSGATNSGAGVPNFDFAFDPPDAPGNPSPRVIIAVIRDILSLQEVAQVDWDMTLEQANTPPEISIDLPDSIPDGHTVEQDATFTVGVFITDKDSLDSWEAGMEDNYGIRFFFDNPIVSNVPLDGSSTYYGGGSPITSDCTRAASETGWSPEKEKFQCTLFIPSSNGNIPVPASGTFIVRAQVEDTITNSAAPEIATPAFLSWNINVTESNTAPFLENIVDSGPATPTVNSYVFDPGDSNNALVAAPEFATITFNLNIDDLEKDNFIIQASHNSSASPTVFLPFVTSPPLEGTKTFAAGDDYQVVSYEIPSDVVEGVPEATITFRIEITDLPDQVPSLSFTHDFMISVTDVNPPPDVSMPTTVFTPDLNAGGYTVIEGYPFTFEINDIRDDGSGPGIDIDWQWEVTPDGFCADASPTTNWEQIIGATDPPGVNEAPQVATLTWSPSAIMSGGYSCIRACIGDNGFGNPADCTSTVAGPWQGTGGLFGVTYALAADWPILSGASAATPTSSYTDIWVDQDNFATDDRPVYMAHVNNNQIVIVRQKYDDVGNIDQSDWRAIPIDGNSNIDDRILHLSITGNDNNLVIGYMYWDEDNIPKNPRAGILRIDKDLASAASPTEFILDDVVSSVGQVVANDEAGWLPYLKSIDADKIHAYYVDAQSAGTTGKQDLGLGTPSNKLMSAEDTINNRLILSAQAKSGELNLSSFTMPNSVSDLIPVNQQTNLFEGRAFDHATMAVGNFASNQKIYLVAQDLNNNLIFTRNNLADLSSDLGVIEIPVADIPELAFFDGIQATAGTEENVYYLGAIVQSAGFQNAFAIRILDDGSTYDADKDLSKMVNSSTFIDMGVTENDHFSLSVMVEDFTIGSASPAAPNENQKDTFWFRYIDRTRIEPRMVIINSEPESFSGSDPALPTDSWTRAWFKK